MALVRLTDAVITEVYNSYTTENNPEGTAFFQSGAVVRNAMLDEAANAKGAMGHVPFWKDIDPSIEPNYSTDDPDVESVPNKIGSGEFQFRKAFLNQSFSDADLVVELTGSDPMRHIRNRFGVYWQRQWQRRCVAILVGVANSNAAAGGDMTIDRSIADGNAATEANLFGRSAFIDAAFTMGDQAESIRAIAVHSMVYKRMIENDDIDMIPDSQGRLSIPTYFGRTVLVDDGLPVQAGGVSGYVYTSILYGQAVLGYGEGTPDTPSAVWREEAKGNGGGIETILERNTWLIHPFGFNWTNASVTAPAGVGVRADGWSPTLADLRKGVNWERATYRKSVPVAFIKTNG